MKEVYWTRQAQQPLGILCGSDAGQEWLLPWWWERYAEHNAFPVTFVDFGMSDQGRSFCRERGESVLLDRDDSFVSMREEIDLERVRTWEGFYGKTLWPCRRHWFKKPFALLHSPYEKTLWLDLDCEVLGPLSEIFSYCSKDTPIALVRELREEVKFNGGVIVFMHGTEIIRRWAQDALTRNDCFWSDDALLSALIQEMEVPVAELPEHYNWWFSKGLHLNPTIHHWLGGAGKAYIKHYGGIKPLLNTIPRGDVE
jgi:hypothetical protein